MQLFLAVAIAAVLAASSARADCLIGEPEKRDLNECEWYSEESCCVSAGNSNSGSSEENNDCGEKTSEWCTDQLTLLGCGIACSPYQAELYKSLTFQVCEDFATKLYNACFYDEFKDEDGKCYVVNEKYDDAESFVENIGGFAVVSNPDDNDPEECFNSASAVATSAALIAAAALAVF